VTEPTGLTDDKLVDKEAILKEFAERQGKARVIVHLKPPPDAPAVVDYNDARSETAYRTANRTHQDAALARLAGDDAKLMERFENQPTLVMEVTEAGLANLQKDADVELIAPVIEMQLHTAQGLPLMGAMTYRTAGPAFRGAGVSIAICDTGIDYNHPQLGGGGFPNAKVVGGYDFGSSDNDPAPDANDPDLAPHGTACAGIAAGDDPGIGGLDYIGGVAPDARLYAIKISPGLTNYQIALAWDWALTHRNDDPANPILVISTSAGFGRYYGSCDWALENLCMLIAAQNAVNAGITLFASAGNDGYCDSIAAPACLSNVISVGAVYDANIGSRFPCINAGSCLPQFQATPPDCAQTGLFTIENTTAADQVAAYSDASPLVHVLAPSNACVTTDLPGQPGYDNFNDPFFGDYTVAHPFGGTSAACPYAAGAAAVIQSATMAVRGFRLTPSQIRDYLQWTGSDVWDPKGEVLTARINLDRAIEMATGVWVDFTYSGAERGTVEEPFNTLAEAVNAAPDGGLINIQSGSSSEVITISKAVTLKAWYGTVTIGQ
jgi:subtilisin family serine protease